jgi:uncharacterized membrane protein YhaH (DUF805 family)
MKIKFYYLLIFFINNFTQKLINMFRAPFSFDGRIRRSEYGISFIIYCIAITFVQLITTSMTSDNSSSYSSSNGNGSGILNFILIIPMLWFLFAQGAKRCHDLGNSGWWQLIPFYSLWLIFADGKPGLNEYGDNPKGIGNNTQFTFEQPQNIKSEDGYSGGYSGGHNN